MLRYAAILNTTAHEEHRRHKGPSQADYSSEKLEVLRSRSCAVSYELRQEQMHHRRCQFEWPKTALGKNWIDF